ERLQPIEPTRLLERFGIELERRMRGEDACAAAGIFLRMSCMRRAVGAEEEARIVARGCLDERFTLPLPLQDRQAVVMRTNAALEERVAIEQKMLRGHRGPDAFVCRAHELDRFSR